MSAPNIPQAPSISGTTHLHSGKVRDLYELDDGPYAGHLLMVASDRISAFDYVLDSTIPGKGEVLTRMSLWWFEQLADLVPHHVVSTDVPEAVRGRALICRRLEMFPVECVARGYLAGSGLLDYRATGEVCGIPLPDGLEDGSRLPEPIFTPATKAALGDHDENVSYDAVVGTVGADAAGRLRELTLAVYDRAETIARDRGIILADTKLEFGLGPRGPHGARRRGAHAGLLPLLAGRRVAAGPLPAGVRQADRSRLAALRGVRLGPLLGCCSAPTAARGRRAHPQQVRRGLRAAHWFAVVRRNFAPGPGRGIALRGSMTSWPASQRGTRWISAPQSRCS